MQLHLYIVLKGRCSNYLFLFVSFICFMKQIRGQGLVELLFDVTSGVVYV